MTLGGIFDPDRLKQRIESLESSSGEEGFWNDREKAEKMLGEAKRLKNKLEPWQSLVDDVRDLEELWLMAKEEKAEEHEAEIRHELESLNTRYEKLRILEFLSEPNDEMSAFLTIHSGAGGTESNDWASMLYRMYTRWLDRHEFSYEIIDLQEAEGGIKSITLEVNGDYAYGYLKAETGVHRLVRISPFDSAGRRHTSFSSVYALPQLDDTITIDIRPEHVRIDTFRAGGAGGQHINKTDSAVRITHLESGIVVQCQNDRSQHKNKDAAYKMLRSRLFDYYKNEQEKEREKTAVEKKDISWGSQIRSYVFQPYTLVKDNRTKVESGNIQAVMDGDIDRFIEAWLKDSWMAKHQQ